MYTKFKGRPKLPYKVYTSDNQCKNANNLSHMVEIYLLEHRAKVTRTRTALELFKAQSQPQLPGLAQYNLTGFKNIQHPAA